MGANSLPFFGLCDINRALSIAATTEQEIGILRSYAVSVGMEWNESIIRYISDETKQEEYATALPFRRRNQKRTSSEDAKPSVGHKRWICSSVNHEREEDEAPDIIRDDIFIGSRGDFDPEDFGSTKKPNPSHQMNFGSPEKPTPTPQIDFKTLFTRQKERYSSMGEEVLLSEEDHLRSITRVGHGTRIIWGITELNLRDPEECWDHWFGPMRHYEYWLGSTDSTAIYIRMDQAKPHEQAILPFSELEVLFEDGNFDTNGLLNALDEAFKSFDTSYMKSLQAFASIYSLYRTLTQSSIDVHILNRPLAHTQWFQSLLGFGNIVSGPSQLLKEKDDFGDESDTAPGESYFMDALKCMEIPTLQRKLPYQPYSAGQLIPMVLNSLKARSISTEQSFSCVLLCENVFDINPNRLENVIALSSNNSLFVDASLTTDPFNPPRRTKIRHVMGNIGKPGTALLVPPIESNMMALGIERWHLINFSAWDGQAADCFADSSLHIWFTGFTQEVDIGYSGAQDKELYIVESVVSLYAKSEWIADLDILKTIHSPSSIYRHTQTTPVSERQALHYERKVHGVPTTRRLVLCEDGHKREYQYDEMPLVTVENWTELLKKTEKNCIFLASGNWQARLAAMMICIAQDRMVCLLSDGVCWNCVNLAKKAPSFPKSPVVYIY